MNVDGLRNEVWDQLLSTVRLTRYYGRLSDRYHRTHLKLRVVLVLATFGVLSPSILPLSEIGITSIWASIWASVAGVTVATCVIMDLVGQYADKGAVLNQISVECQKLENAWRILWQDCDDQYADSEELERRFKKLLDKDTTQDAGKARIAEDAKLNEQCWKDVLDMETQKYAA